MARRIIPKLCLSTILIEVGIICALVAVNLNTTTSILHWHTWASGAPKSRNTYIPAYETNIYGWPRPFLHTHNRSADDTNTQKYSILVDGLFIDLMAWLTIIVVSAVAFEVLISIWYAKPLIKRSITDPPDVAE